MTARYRPLDVPVPESAHARPKFAALARGEQPRRELPIRTERRLRARDPPSASRRPRPVEAGIHVRDRRPPRFADRARSELVPRVQLLHLPGDEAGTECGCGNRWMPVRMHRLPAPSDDPAIAASMVTGASHATGSGDAHRIARSRSAMNDAAKAPAAIITASATPTQYAHRGPFVQRPPRVDLRRRGAVWRLGEPRR